MTNVPKLGDVPLAELDIGVLDVSSTATRKW
jgi:hypothetical protein